MKFCNSYLLNTKEKYEIYALIRKFIDKYGKSNYLITDNWKEFKNNALGEYCKNNNMKFINLLSYRPHSKWVVEIIHHLIKKGTKQLSAKIKESMQYWLCYRWNKKTNNLFFRNSHKKILKKLIRICLKAKNIQIFTKILLMK